MFSKPMNLTVGVGRYIRNICDWFGYPAVANSNMWNEDLCDLLVVVMHLFLIISQYDCYEEEVVC